MIIPQVWHLVIRRHFANFVERVKPPPRNKVVRVRFAPSPTGYLHLGGLRTALYNLLFARSHGGQLVLRIEDTDQSRVVPGALEQLERDLAWAGVVPDEGPSAGGAYGPYVQSQRTHLYRTQAQVLLDQGKAYHCFCSEKRLDLLRREAMRLRQVPRYDNKCRDLSEEEAQHKISQGQPHCVRFKLTPLREPIHDQIYGPNDYEPFDNEGDPVILKQDGFPTYHLANVVDDHMMVVTHVLRGVEWYVSTPKHVLLYKAFGWDAPQYAHLPLILNHDGSKLSKRQDDVRVESYRHRGVFPLALMNFISKAGGGFKNMDLDKIYSLDELAQMFDLGLVHNSSCKLTERLMEYNQAVLKQMVCQEDKMKEMVSLVIDKVKAAYPNYRDLDMSEEHVKKVIIWGKDRIERLEDLLDEKMSFLWVVPSVEILSTSKANPAHIKLILEEVRRNSENFKTEPLKASLKKLADDEKLSFSKLMKITRTALSGLKEGPSIVEMMEILGRDSVISRLSRTISILEKNKSS